MTLADKWNGILDEIINKCKTLDELGDQTVNNGFNATTGTLSVGTLYAVQFTGLPTGKFIDSIDLDVTVAAGNVRVKLYRSSQGKPDLLIGESEALPVLGTGVQNFRFIKQVEVPIDGQAWVALETDNAALDVVQSTGQSVGTLYTVTHTFGVGPAPWSGGSAGSSPFWTQLHYEPKVVKYAGVRAKQPEDFFACVYPAEMNATKLINRGSNNTFITNIDLSYRGVDFQNASTKMLKKASEIYDAIHMTTLNGQVQYAKVDISFDEIIEGEQLYMVPAKIQITAEKVVLQI